MTRANTTRPTGAQGMERPKAGGEHSDNLESGLPNDKASAGAGNNDEGVGYKPDGKSSTEGGDYGGVETGNRRGAAGPMPSTAKATGVPAKGVIGDGRGSSGKFCGTMGSGATGEPKSKGTIGNC